MKRQEPFNVLRDPNAWSSAPRAEAIAFSLFGSGFGTAAAFAASTAGQIAIAGVSLGLSVATNAIISALTPAPPTPKQSLLVNSRDAAAPQEFVYGEVRKGGPITYLETTRGGSVLYQIIPLAAHEIESVEAIYINDEVATLSADGYDNGDRTGAGWVTSPRKWSEDDDADKHEIRIFYHLGDQTSITDTFANSSVESLDSVFFDTGSSDEDSQNFGGVGQPTKASFVGNGIAYLFVRYGYAADVFRNGLPVITARIKGKKVFDPRTSTTAYSNNAALCIRDYLTSAYGLSDAQVDATVFSNAANVCDENVTLAAGGTEDRYTLNGVVRADQSYGDVLQQMVTSCAGTLFWGGGKWKLAVGAYNAPTKTLTLDDLRSNISLQTRVNLRDQFNKVQGVFNDANQRYIAADYPPIESASFLAQDNGVAQALDLDLPFTTSAAMAQRLAKMTLFRGREQMVFQAEFGMNAFDVEVGEIVALTIDRYGWTAKEFEVVNWRFFIGSEGDMRIAMALRETSAAAFSWTAEESEIIGNDTDLDGTLPAVTNLTATANGQVLADGTFLSRILVDWDSVPGSIGYEVSWMINDVVDYTTNGGAVEDDGTFTAREQLVYDSFIEILYRQPGQNGFDYYVSGGGASLTEQELRDELNGSPEKALLKFAGVTVRNPTTSYNIAPVLDNTIYFIRVRAFAGGGNFSPYRAVNFTTIPDAGAPAAPTGVTATGDLGNILLEWTNPPDADLKEIEVWENSSDVLGTATLLAAVSGSSYVRANLGPEVTKYYWLRSVDFTGNTSGYTASVNATTRKITTADIGDAVIPWDALDASVETVIDSKISTLEATVGDTYATITEVSLIENDVTDIEAKYGVTIDVNGSITGYQLLNGVGGSAFNVRADQFAVFSDTGAGGDNPFTVFTSPRLVNGTIFPAGTYIRDAFIDRAAIVAASIDTLELKGEAVTVPLAQTVADGVNDVSGDGTLKEAQWLNFTLPQDGNVTIMWDAKHAYSPGFSSTNEQHYIRLTIAPAGTTAYNVSNEVRVKSGILADDYPTMLYEGGLTGGTAYRVSIWWEGTTNMDLLGRTLVIMGSMR